MKGTSPGRIPRPAAGVSSTIRVLMVSGGERQAQELPGLPPPDAIRGGATSCHAAPCGTPSGPPPQPWTSSDCWSWVYPSDGSGLVRWDRAEVGRTLTGPRSQPRPRSKLTAGNRYNRGEMSGNERARDTRGGSAFPQVSQVAQPVSAPTSSLGSRSMSPLMKIGYGRVPARDHHPDAQLDALGTVGCEEIFLALLLFPWVS
jgi:hypothetical protein